MAMAPATRFSAFSEPDVEAYAANHDPLHVLDGKAPPGPFTIILPPVAGLFLLVGSQEH